MVRKPFPFSAPTGSEANPIRFPRRLSRNPRAFAALLVALVPLIAIAQANDNPTPVLVNVAPVETKEVVAEGQAAIGDTGIPGARQAAIGQALRAAVEKALGVYVSARTLTQNYQMVRDQVLTRSEGYATLKDLVSVRVGTQEVRVTVRALVSLRPLAQQLKTLRLTRVWRIHIAVKSNAEDAAEAIASLENTLTNAGFAVVAEAKDADISVQITPRFEKIADIPAESGSYSATIHSVRGNLTARALRVGTSEVVAALSAAGTEFHVSADAARSQAAAEAAELLAPRLVDALLVLPAANAQPVTLIVSGLKSAAQAGKLENLLNNLTGVQRVSRRAYANGSATWEIDILTDAAALLPRALEENAVLRPFKLSIASENRSRVVAIARPAL